MFLTEVTSLTRKGLKAAYLPVEANENFYKGKILVSQHIKNNLVNKARFYVGYDHFSKNRPENRLIKSTLQLLLRLTNNYKNRQSAMGLLSYFEEVNLSANYALDFSSCSHGRETIHYSKALAWCRIFLCNESFTPFAGKEIAFALLFPMETIFESYVAAKLRQYKSSDTRLHVQDHRFGLFDIPRPSFGLCPDIVLERRGLTCVMDTKWKLLSDGVRYGGISQADMYQMYAYGKKYKAERVVLIYPNPDSSSEIDLAYSANDGVRVEIFFVDLRDAERSILDLLDKATLASETFIPVRR